MIGVLRGEGEGDVRSDGELGFSGLATALATEGYGCVRSSRPRSPRSPTISTRSCCWVPGARCSPSRSPCSSATSSAAGACWRCSNPARRAASRGCWKRWGIQAPEGVIVDPASGAPSDGASGTQPIAYNYESHPVAQGLTPDRMTFFAGVRPLVPHNPSPDDSVRRVVLASPRSWVTQDLSVLSGRRRRRRPRPRGRTTTRSRRRGAIRVRAAKRASSQSATATSPRTATCGRSTTWTWP